MRLSKLSIPFLIAAVCASAPADMNAQGFLKKIKDKTEKVKNEAKKLKNEVDKLKQGAEKAGIDVSGQKKTQSSEPQNAPDSGAEGTENRSDSGVGATTGDVVKAVVSGPTFDTGIGLDEAEYKKQKVYGGVAVEQQSERYNVFKWGDFSDGMAPVLDGENFYFLTLNGERKLEGIHKQTSRELESFPRFDKGRTLIKTKEGNGLVVDKEGKVIKNLGPVVSVYGFVDGVGGVVKKIDNMNKSFHMIDVNGNKIFPGAAFSGYIPPMTAEAYQLFHKPSDGLMAYAKLDPAKKKLLWGFLNTADGSVAVAPKFNKVSDFHNGVAAVKAETTGLLDDGKWYYIDKKGKSVFELQFREKPADFVNKYIVVTNDNYSTSVLAVDGQVLYTYPYGSGVDVGQFSTDDYSLMTVSGNGSHDRFIVRIEEKEDNGKTERKLVRIKKLGSDVSIPRETIYGSDGMMYDKGLGDRLTPYHPLKGTAGFIVSRPFEGDYAATKWGWVDRDGKYIIRMNPKE